MLTLTKKFIYNVVFKIKNETNNNSLVVIQFLVLRYTCISISAVQTISSGLFQTLRDSSYVNLTFLDIPFLPFSADISNKKVLLI